MHTPAQHAHTRRALVLIAGLAVAMASGGCAGGKKNPAANAAPNTGLAALATGQAVSAPMTVPKPNPAATGIPDWTQDKSLDLQKVVKQLEAQKAAQALAADAIKPQTEPVVATTTAAPAATAEQPAQPAEDPAKANTGTDVTTIVTNPTPVETPKSLDEQIASTSLSLVDLLRRKSLEDPAPFQHYIALAMLEAIHPGSVQQIITASSTSATPLSPEEQKMVESLRGFGQGANQLASVAKAGSIADAFKRLADMTKGVEAVLSMRVSSTALATRVIGFGRFTPVPGNAFLAGSEIRTLVYTEIEHFAYRPLSESEALSLSQRANTGVDPADRWAVEIGQELQLFDAAGEVVWKLPEQVVMETSRNQRRDFFLVNDVTLPSALTPGQYALKVIMRDRTSGTVDEQVVNLMVSADATLANAQP